MHSWQTFVNIVSVWTCQVALFSAMMGCFKCFRGNSSTLITCISRKHMLQKRPTAGDIVLGKRLKPCLYEEKSSAYLNYPERAQSANFSYIF